MPMPTVMLESEKLDLNQIKASLEDSILNVNSINDVSNIRKQFKQIVEKIEGVDLSEVETTTKQEILELNTSIAHLEGNIHEIAIIIPATNIEFVKLTSKNVPIRQEYNEELAKAKAEYEKWLKTGKKDGAIISLKDAAKAYTALKKAAHAKLSAKLEPPKSILVSNAQVSAPSTSITATVSTPLPPLDFISLASLPVGEEPKQEKEEKDYDAVSASVIAALEPTPSPDLASVGSTPSKEPIPDSEGLDGIDYLEQMNHRKYLVEQIDANILSLGEGTKAGQELISIRDKLTALMLSELTPEIIDAFRTEALSVNGEGEPLNLEPPQMEAGEHDASMAIKRSKKDEAIAYLDGLISPLKDGSDKKNRLIDIDRNLVAMLDSDLNLDLIQGYRDAALQISREGIAVIEEVQDELPFEVPPLEVPEPYAYDEQPLVNENNDDLSPEEIASYMQQFALMENPPLSPFSPAREEPVLADRLDQVQNNHVVQPTPAPEPIPEPDQNKLEQNSQDASIPTSAEEIQIPAPEQNEENDYQNQAVALLAELSKKNSNQADYFEKAYKLLGKILQEESTNQDMQIKARGIHKQIMTLKGSSNQKYLPLLTETLLRTVLLTLNPLDNEAVSNCAKLNEKIVKSMPNSRSKQMLCGLVTALGLTAIALGILVCVGTLGLGAVAGIVLSTVGTVMATGGAGLLFFNRHTDAKETKMLKDLDSSIKDFTSPQLA